MNCLFFGILNSSKSRNGLEDGLDDLGVLSHVVLPVVDVVENEGLGIARFRVISL